MDSSPRFLIVDFHAESRFLLGKTLLRKFPGATIFESDEADAAIALVHQHRLNAIVTHRTFDASGPELVRAFRAAEPAVPIIMVSGEDREDVALAAGADQFLPYEEWLRIGSVVEAMLRRSAETTGAGLTIDARVFGLG